MTLGIEPRTFTTMSEETITHAHICCGHGLKSGDVTFENKLKCLSEREDDDTGNRTKDLIRQETLPHFPCPTSLDYVQYSGSYVCQSSQHVAPYVFVIHLSICLGWISQHIHYIHITYIH